VEFDGLANPTFQLLASFRRGDAARQIRHVG
jgi:hypothetical protein